jgi:hypothetical protein
MTVLVIFRSGGKEWQDNIFVNSGNLYRPDERGIGGAYSFGFAFIQIFKRGFIFRSVRVGAHLASKTALSRDVERPLEYMIRYKKGDY